MNEGDFKLSHFFDTAKSASRRVRWVLIIIVVASILASVAAFNTRSNDWTTLRMNWAVKELKKIKELDMTPESQVNHLFLTNLLHMYQSKWVDNCYIEMPFFGVVLDVNDLGAASGLGFLIILIMFRYSRRTELNAFHAIFSKARDEDQLKECYTLLSETQVLTIPSFGPNVQGKFWRWSPTQKLVQSKM